MVKIGRGRLAPTLAAASLALAAARPPPGVFSCGSRLAAARACSVLCPAGDDDGCPPGQRCYGGVPCRGGEDAARDARERQRPLEAREAERLAREREEDRVGRFVCGGSHDDAAGRCAAASSDGGSPAGAAAYCPDGSSDRCPVGTRCYAAVPCPRSTHAEEPLLWRERVPPGPPGSFPVTEPILLNSTAGSGDHGGVSRERGGWFAASPWREWPSAVPGAASSLLSRRCGSN